jgi:hypothetical protein
MQTWSSSSETSALILIFGRYKLFQKAREDSYEIFSSLLFSTLYLTVVRLLNNHNLLRCSAESDLCPSLLLLANHLVHNTINIRHYGCKYFKTFMLSHYFAIFGSLLFVKGIHIHEIVIVSKQFNWPTVLF